MHSRSCAMLALVAIALLCLCASTATASPVHAAAAASPYVVALAQHPGSPAPPSSTAAVTKAANLAAYASMAQAAQRAGAQVLAFPEFGLLGKEDMNLRATTLAYAELVPNCPANCTALNINPCREGAKWQNSPAVLRGSCMASNSSLLTLINLFESLPCSRSDPSCPPDGQFVFVTDVLFDRRGNLVAKYRKSHPFYVNAVNAPPRAEEVYYTSDFGVTFGLFICFDIAFPHPAVDLVQRGVKHFLYAAAIGQVGSATVARLWSGTHQATLLLANAGANSSAVIVRGSAQAGQVVKVPGSQDTLFVTKVLP